MFQFINHHIGSPVQLLVTVECQDAAECSTSVLRITSTEECSTSKRRKVDYVVLPPTSPQPEGPEPQVSKQTLPNARQLFKCKNCEKVFTSHQALGSHRSSHKKLPLHKKRPKVHECSICKRKFPSGQALGGHKRFHWRASSSPDTTNQAFMSVVATELQAGNSSSGFNCRYPHTLRFRFLISTLGLNMPVPMNDFPEVRLYLDMPNTTMFVQPGRESTSENASNVNMRRLTVGR
ncbi:zinc finger protein ZAT1-like [Dendrobium catenatum]|uniref:zinc finger protein ZAT1-like n=1 Tax=Dendrobium catenatum TaxID=906689 RepID=UPI0009F2CB12|nr:zinc finger protein ZAT1-like [Dendrobium catenatum]